MENMMSFFLPMIVSFLIAVAIAPFLIKKLILLKVGNTEREELESHQKKMGTPSMGGIIFLIAFVISCVIFGFSADAMAVILMSVAFGAIGFADDYLKAKKRHADGFKAKQKFILQILVTIIFEVYIVIAKPECLALYVPLVKTEINLGIIFPVILMFIAILGTVNGANFTDGLDGLCTTVTLPIVAFLCLASIRLNPEMVPVATAFIGALLGYLMYNVYPAKVFMGDTGSLAIGAYVVTFAYLLKLPILVIIICFIYLLEVISVIIQVSYFKLTKKKYGEGKRIFRMAPIHHHFELGGWSEVKVVAVFATVTALLCVFAYCICF